MSYCKVRCLTFHTPRLMRYFSSNSPGERKNLAAVLHGIKDLRLVSYLLINETNHFELKEEKPIKKINDHQVLLQMESVGICGSDVNILEHGKIGPYAVERPMVTGHEASGTVLEIGKKVKHLVPGDPVCIEPGVGCRKCLFCKDGRYNLCEDMRFCANPPIDGNLCRYFVHDADFCFRIPDNMTLDEGALMEPFAVGVHCCKQAQLRFGDKVLILGSGPIGLVTMMVAKAMGASTVLVTDLMKYRLMKAKHFGADFIYRITPENNEVQQLKDIRDILKGNPRVSIDCSGSHNAIRLALQATKAGGIVVLAGMDDLEMTIPLMNTIFREVRIKGAFRYNNDYQMAIEIVRTGKVKLQGFITHHFKIEDTIKAFQVARTKEGNPIKIMIHPNPSWKGCATIDCQDEKSKK